MRNTRFGIKIQQAEHQDPNREKWETKDFVDVLFDAHIGEMSLIVENIKSLILVSESIIINIYIYIRKML